MLLRGRHGTYGTGLVRWHAWSALVAGDVAVFCAACVALGDIVGNAGVSCVAGMALGDIDLHSVWQAPGTWRHRPSLCVARVAFMALGWLLWRAWFPFVAVDASTVCVAGVALGVHFVWQAWRLATSTFTLRGRCGTYGTGLLWWRVVVDAAAVCVASVAFGASTSIRCGRGATWWHRFAFAWQVWHLAASTSSLCGRRRTWRQWPSLAWQAWHLWHWSGGCHSPLLMVLACRLWLHHMITPLVRTSTGGNLRHNL